jgi:hypothetical protein
MGRNSVQEHPQLVQVVARLLDGRPCSEIAQEFGLELEALRAYAEEAGLEPGKPPTPDPEPELPQPEPEEAAEPEDVADRGLVHERQVLEEGSRRRGEPAGHRPDPAAHPYQDESRAALRGILGQAEAERRAYEAQPLCASLSNDPLGPPGFEFHRGMQPASRLLALAMRERAEREARRAEWFQDPFHWCQEPPEEWFD